MKFHKIFLILIVSTSTLLTGGCSYTLMTYAPYDFYLDRVINKTNIPLADVILERALKEEMRLYRAHPQSVTGGVFPVRAAFTGFGVYTAIYSPSVPMQGARASTSVYVLDSCGRKVLARSFTYTWNFPTESTIKRTEIQKSRVMEIVIAGLAREIATWLAAAKKRLSRVLEKSEAERHYCPDR